MGKMERLRDALAAKVTDEFEIGDVIRWTGGGIYTYAAIKTSVGWFTTARGSMGNGFVAKEYTYEALVELLASADVSVVEIATGWEAV